MSVFAYLDESGGGWSAVNWIVLAVLVVAYLLFTYWAAEHAQKKGHSFLGFLLLGLFFSPVISGIAALILEDKGAGRPVMPVTSGDHLDQLKKLTELRDSGTLSDAEFETEKARILGGR